MKRLLSTVAVLLLPFACASAQSNDQQESAGPTLKVNSRAVLVDVIVTDKNGNPVKGLKQSDFTILEDGTPQSPSFFEEHTAEDLAARSSKLEFPSLPPNVFSNYSPLPTPPAVNVLLLDALNTPADDQMWLRRSAQKYLKTLKPGTRLAIFTMGMRLSFVEGFSDDPALLAMALGYRKFDKAEAAVMLQSMGELNALNSVIALMVAQENQGPDSPVPAVSPESVAAFQNFLQETRYGQDSDREYKTLADLNQLATFLGGFPGRKNVIWMSGAFPLELFGKTDMRFDDSIKTTINLLSAARVAIYPVDARGATVQQFYTAENILDPTITNGSQLLGAPPGASANPPNAGQSQGGFAGSLLNESEKRGNSNSTMDMLAEQTGGKAFYNQNDLTSVIAKVVGSSADFYTLSYAPTNANMNGAFRNIAIKAGDGKYKLSYRRGYFAREENLPGAAGAIQHEAAVEASEDPTKRDPLAPFMEFGMPQTEQILYKAHVHHADAKPGDDSDHDQNNRRYAIDFAVDLADVGLKLEPDGNRHDTLNISWIVYDRYGQVVSREDHLVQLNVKPDVYPVFQKNGVQLHGAVKVPKGDYWLRTGIYDERTRKVGTMEVPLRLVRDELATR
ncbi:VWA domain-containing protein [Occallatibacter savannae]|uniref:VWA domain-containing protein n=1 Tax=Occallatibacter savannae TaxID=1002691 RepID=UPI000D69DD61|nr:VWA domain-containing protein [Occallatibacter savannae]